jgi:hypothetical protein
MLESKIEKTSVKAADKLGFWSFKLLSTLVSGLPDRVFIGHGVVVFIEYKRPGGKVSKMQEFIHRKFLKHGVVVHVAYSVEDTRRILADALN